MTDVVLLKCDSYKASNLRSQIERGFNLLGGVERFSRRVERILLKPNLLVPSPPEAAVTTHPLFFAAVAEIFIDSGAEVIWGDSPAVGGVGIAARRTGIQKEANRLGIKKGDFSNTKKINYEEGRRARSFNVVRAAAEADGVVSLPKMKPHGLMRITGAVKNQFGCIAGLHKAEYHLKFQKRPDFAQMLVDLTGCLKPRLYIADAVLAMEGDGPRSGDPKWMNTVLMGTDPVAVDAAFCRLINLNPEYVLTNTLGANSGIGAYSEKEIRILGDSLDELQDKSFRIERKPAVYESAISFFGRLSRAVYTKKPVVLNERCVKCGTCVEICPTEPKSMRFVNDNQSEPPEVDYDSCIRCYCCYEVCPEKAIVLSSPLKMIFSK